MQIGIDLGATKIESIVLDDKGEELYREREESPHNYQETLNSINLIGFPSRPPAKSNRPYRCQCTSFSQLILTASTKLNGIPSS